MTITAPDFEHQIDAAPRGDPDVRFAYADWLEESGDSAGARFQRWMGEHERAAWQSHYRHGKYTWLHGEPSDGMSRLPWCLYSGCDDYYDTRIEAEQALRTALESVDYEVTW